MNKDMFSFDLGLFSKYRGELMGVATLMIIICHSPHYIFMPEWLQTILGNGGTGCDVFLFLSGFGICNSYSNNLAKGKSLISWYWKRYVRITVPCVLIILLVFVLFNRGAFQDMCSLTQNLLGVYYLTGHPALWYVSCTLLLYILTPIVHGPFIGCNKWLWLVVFCFLSLLLAYVNFGNGPIIHNWQFCICRWPSFFIGYVLSSSIKQHREGSILWFVVLPLCAYTAFFVLNHTIGTNFSLFWTQGIPVMTIAVIVIDKIHSSCVNGILDWLGNISLESYATNIYLVSYLIAIPLLLGDISFHHYDFIAYVVGTLVCFFVSCLIHKVSSSIIKWLAR